MLNADDENVMALTGRFGGKVLTFGLRGGSDVRAERVVARVDGHTSYDLLAGGARARVRLAFLGLHNVQNSLAAAAAALSLGFGPEEIVEGLGRCRPLAMRLELRSLPGGVTVVNDTYNANPGSVRAAVETFLTLVARGRRWVVLGDMLELGSHSIVAHQQIGEFIASRGVDMLVTVGRESEPASRAFEQSAAAGRKGRHLPGHEEAAALLLAELRAGDILLVKASRGMTLERVVEYLEQRLGAAPGEGA